MFFAMPVEFFSAMLVALGFLVLFAVMTLLVKWARRRSSAALTAGALLSAFAPDPELEKNIRLAEQAKTVQMEEDEEGEKYF